MYSSRTIQGDIVTRQHTTGSGYHSTIKAASRAALPYLGTARAGQACIQLLFEGLLATTGSFSEHDPIRPVQTTTEVALFVHLLPESSKASQVNYTLMAIEFNNAVLQGFRAGFICIFGEC